MAELIPLPPSDNESAETRSVGSESWASSSSNYQPLTDARNLFCEGRSNDPLDESSTDAVRREISRAYSPSRASPIRPTLQRLFDEGFDNIEEFHVKIGEETQHIPRDELLDFFWTDRAETPCMVCQGDFSDNHGPPVRTYSLNSPELPEGEDSVLALSGLIVQLRNRHLNCLIETCGMKFVPISHVWHSEVSDAHLSRKSTRDAIALSWFVPVRILNSATRKLKENDNCQQVEIWHDYLSVPQWNYTIQQQLLLYLPAIFKGALTTLIHLDDIPESILVTAWNRDAMPYEMATSMYEFLGSHWFSHLWVALEYMSSRQSCLMIEEAKIVQNEGGKPLNSFRAITDYFQRITREICIRQGPDFANLMLDKYANQTHHLYSNFQQDSTGRKTFHLGEIYGLVCKLSCRDYRDRFIAITGLLALGNYTEVSREIPADTTEACLWVAWKCLERGDYTPLLLIPTGEAEVPHARWLRGHEKMDEWMWTAGNINQDAENLDIIQNGVIKPELEYVGRIEEACYIGFWLRAPLEAFEIVVTYLLTKGNIDNAVDLVNTLLRIYAVPPYIEKNYPHIPSSYEEYCTGTPNFHAELDSLIFAYLEALMGIIVDSVQEICQELANKLRFEEVYTANLSAYTRLGYACTFADSLHYQDSLVRVRCQGCKKASVFRVALYRAYDIGWVGQKLYRVPGLGCDGFPGNGIGVIMAGTLVRGRTTFATPACECRIRERVLVE